MPEIYTKPLGYDEDLTEVTSVYSVTKQLTEMTSGEAGEPSGEMLEMVSQYLDTLKVEDPGMADLMIDTANKWKRIETSVTPEDLSVLLKASQSIPQQDGCGEFLQNLIKDIDDSDLIIVQLGDMFKDNRELTRVLSSNSELRALWYDHLYQTLRFWYKNVSKFDC